MTIFLVERFVVKPDKLAEFPTLVNKWKAMVKSRPELFKEMKSYKIYSDQLGGNWGGGTWMTEVESLAELEKAFNKVMGDKEYMTHMEEWYALIVLGTYSISVWSPVP
jgi:lipopolysaccharide/colanic/teichoic acid biosynthesis glycosyltransferase